MSPRSVLNRVLGALKDADGVGVELPDDVRQARDALARCEAALAKLAPPETTESDAIRAAAEQFARGGDPDFTSVRSAQLAAADYHQHREVLTQAAALAGDNLITTMQSSGAALISDVLAPKLAEVVADFGT